MKQPKISSGVFGIFAFAALASIGPVLPAFGKDHRKKTLVETLLQARSAALNEFQLLKTAGKNLLALPLKLPRFRSHRIAAMLLLIPSIATQIISPRKGGVYY